MESAMSRAGRRTQQKRAWASPVMGLACLGAAFYVTMRIEWPLGLIVAIPMGFVALYLILVAKLTRGS